MVTCDNSFTRCVVVWKFFVWLAGASSFSFCGSDNEFLVPSEFPKCLKHERNPQLRFSLRESLVNPFAKAKE